MKNIFPTTSTVDWKVAFHNVAAQKITYVALGVDNLRKWSNYSKPVIPWIETTNINGDSRYSLTPSHVKAEVWMSIIHGARGIGYFCHQFASTEDSSNFKITQSFIEAGLLYANASIKNAVASINAQITSLASVINSQSVSNGVLTTNDYNSSDNFVDTMVKRVGGKTYLFAISMKPINSFKATFTLRGFSSSGVRDVVVIGENRTLTSNGGVFTDSFGFYGVHIYSIISPDSSDYATWVIPTAISLSLLIFFVAFFLFFCAISFIIISLFLCKNKKSSSLELKMTSK